MTRPDRTLPDRTVARMVRAVRPEWRVREATLADSGFAAVYRLAVETPDGRRECYLKATPDGDRHGIDAEARLLAVLGRHTSIPVPGVLGAVDAHDDLPAPFFVAGRLPGTAVAFEDLGTPPDAALRRVARESGAFLAELHAVDAVDAFGVVDRDRSTALDGGRPPADGDELVVADPAGSWPALVRRWADAELDRHGSTRFGGLTPRLRAALDRRVGALSGSFDPVLARVDHGLHNLLVEPPTGEVTGVVDWGFTLAATRAYDLACVGFVLGGAVLAGVPGTPDRTGLVGAALRSGYRSRAAVPREFDEHRDCYDLLASVRSMNHLAAGVAAVPDEHVDAAADAHRRAVRACLD